MEHFLASQVDITYVLPIYPSIVLPKTTLVTETEKLVDLDDPHLSRASSGFSDDMESPLHQLESDENTSLESKKMNHNTLMALIKFLQKKRHNIIEKATAEGTEEVVLDAVGDRFKKSYKVKSRNFCFFASLPLSCSIVVSLFIYFSDSDTMFLYEF